MPTLTDTAGCVSSSSRLRREPASDGTPERPEREDSPSQSAGALFYAGCSWILSVLLASTRPPSVTVSFGPMRVRVRPRNADVLTFDLKGGGKTTKQQVVRGDRAHAREKANLSQTVEPQKFTTNFSGGEDNRCSSSSLTQTSEVAPITLTTDPSDQSGGVAQEESCWFAHRAANGGSFLQCTMEHPTPLHSKNKIFSSPVQKTR